MLNFKVLLVVGCFFALAKAQGWADDTVYTGTPVTGQQLNDVENLVKDSLPKLKYGSFTFVKLNSAELQNRKGEDVYEIDLVLGLKKRGGVTSKCTSTIWPRTVSNGKVVRIVSIQCRSGDQTYEHVEP